jgi:CRISPR-associated endonuclease Csn1
MNGKNYLYLLYEGMVNEKMERDYDLINLKTFVENKELFNKPISEIPQKDVYYRNKLKGKLPCIAKLKVGQLVMMFKENKDELKEISTYDIKKRLYKIRQLETDGRIIFDYHLEARKKEDVKKEVGDGKSQIDFEKPYPKLRLTKSNFYFTIEGKDFEIKPDGEIKWLF